MTWSIARSLYDSWASCVYCCHGMRLAAIAHTLISSESRFSHLFDNSRLCRRLFIFVSWKKWSRIRPGLYVTQSSSCQMLVQSAKRASSCALFFRHLVKSQNVHYTHYQTRNLAIELLCEIQYLQEAQLLQRCRATLRVVDNFAKLFKAKRNDIME